MLVTLLGMSIDSRMDSLKANSPMDSSVDPSAKDTVRASVYSPHLWKAYLPMLVTLAGMLTDSKCAQFTKAPPPMLVTLLGMSIDFRLA